MTAHMNNNPPNPPPSVTDEMIEAARQVELGTWRKADDAADYFTAIYLAMRAADQPPPNTDLTDVERAEAYAKFYAPTPDRSGEADETRSGSAVGESGLPRSGRPNEVK